MTIDKFTGRKLDLPSDNLPSFNGNQCDDCGCECIDKCFICGAPQCCINCCINDNMKEIS